MTNGAPRFWRTMLLAYLFVGIAAASVSLVAETTTVALAVTCAVIAVVFLAIGAHRLNAVAKVVS